MSEVLFLGIEEPNKKEDSKYEEESDAEEEVNMEAKLLSALNELKRYRNKYKHPNNFVIEQREKQEQEEKEIDSLISELRSQIMEAKKREECLEELLKEKQQICEQLDI